MMYEVANQADWGAIAEFLEMFDYFSPVNIPDYGGHWIVAKDDFGKMHGCLWFFGEPPHIHIDYWAADGPRTAARLGVAVRNFCEEHKVKFVHGIIAADNINANRLAVEGLGMMSAGPYNRVFKEVEHGDSKGDTDDDNPRGWRPGTGDHEPPVSAGPKIGGPTG